MEKHFQDKAMPSVLNCEMKDCAFNYELECHAMAVNVGGPQDSCPKCDTLFLTNAKGGNQEALAGVGACKVETCHYNNLFGCSARTVIMKRHGDHTDCATFLPR